MKNNATNSFPLENVGICKFPDQSEVVVRILDKNVTHTKIEWDFQQHLPLNTTAWINSSWIHILNNKTTC